MATGDILAVRISNATNGNGWVAEIDIENLAAGGTYAFGSGTNNATTETAKVVFTVTSEGYNTAKELGTTTRTVYGIPDVNVGAVRKAYPNQASPDETVVSTTLTIRVALSDFIYQDDTVTATILSGFYTKTGTPNNATTDLAVTNNSTLAYPTSVGRWAWVPYEQVQSSPYVIEATIFNRFAKNGKPVAAVEFTCTDEHAHSVVVNVLEMTKSTRDSASASGNSVLVYAATVDLSTLTALDKITCNFKVYPWVGHAASVLDSSTNSDPDDRLTPFVFLNDKNDTLQGGFAIVDPANGATWSSGHANVFATEAEAVTAYGTTSNSWKYIGDALKAIKDYNDNHSGTGVADLGGGTVLLIAGNHSDMGVTAPTITAMQNTWVTIRPLSSITDNTSVVINVHTAVKYPLANGKYHWKNVTVNSADAYTLGNGSSISAHLWIDNVAFTTAGAQSISGLRYSYATNCTSVSAYDWLLKNDSLIQAWRLVRGNKANRAATVAGRYAHPYCVLGNDGLIPAQSSVDTGNARGLAINDNAIWAFNTNTGYTGTAVAVLSFGLVTERPQGIAIVQNLVETPVNGASVAFSIVNDSSTVPSNNVIIWNNTIVGNRCNLGYNDVGTNNNLHKNWSVVGNILWNINNKDDTFGVKKTNTGISKAAAAVITSNSHGFVVGNKIYFEGITDADYVFMNGNTYTISAKDTNTYTINADTSAAAANCSSGCGTGTTQNPVRVGSWPVGYKVGWFGNVILTAVGQEWFGESTGLNSTAYNTATFTFVKDATNTTGDSSGTGGDYHLAAGASALNFIPSSKSILPFDITGIGRRDDGTGAAGAYEFPAAGGLSMAVAMHHYKMMRG